MTFNNQPISTPKTNCVQCGAPSKWVCPGCRQWYCQKCAPYGFCSRHFQLLNHEDQEFISWFYPQMLKKFKLFPLLIFGTMAILLLSIFGFFQKVQSYMVMYLIIGATLICFIPFFLLIIPVMKHIPRIMKIARTYNHSTPSNASNNTLYQDHSYKNFDEQSRTSYTYSSHTNSDVFKPIRNIEAENQQFKPITDSVAPNLSRFIPIIIFLIFLTIIAIFLMSSGILDSFF
jgi:hypothetical protein